MSEEKISVSLTLKEWEIVSEELTYPLRGCYYCGYENEEVVKMREILAKKIDEQLVPK